MSHAAALVERTPKRTDSEIEPNSKERFATTLLEPDRGSTTDNVLMGLFCFIMAIFTVVIVLGDRLWLPKDPLEWCQAAQRGIPWKQYANRDAMGDPCYYERTIYLLGWSLFECDFGRRMLTSVVLGAAIGYERKQADRPAGIRTMSLVCLGAATFTMGGQFAFRSSTMGWDAARVSAAIPSGVGFLGSALIWKEATGEKGGQNQKNHVHGITTAASVWLSASVGIGVGGALYVTSTWTVILVIFLLRLGPRLVVDDDRSYNGNSSVEGNTMSNESDWDNSNDADLQEGQDRNTGDLEEEDGTYPTREEEFQLLKMESQGAMPASISYKKSLSYLRKKSIRIQDKQVPSLHSD